MLAPEFLPVWGGVGTYIVELVRHLPKNIETHVMTPQRFGFGKYGRFSTSDYDLARYFGSNVHVHYVCKASETFFYNAKFQYACLKQVPKLVKEEHIDLIHSHTAHMPDLLLQFKELYVPTITTIHTTIEGQRNGTKHSGMKFGGLESSEKLTYLTYPFLRLAEIIYFSRRRYYLTVSDWMRDQVCKQYPKIGSPSISVVHNSVDTELFSPNKGKETPRRPVVLFTGRLIAAKGIMYLVEAMPRVLREYPEALFIFIGAGNAFPYQRRLKKIGVSEKNFQFLGYLKEQRDMVDYYRAASVYVAPTLYENLPIRILEAMACGVPVVASNVCAIPEAIDSGVNGMLVQPGAVHDLSRAICLLLNDETLRKKIGDSARKTVLEKFDCGVNTLKTVEIYKEILSVSVNKGK